MTLQFFVGKSSYSAYVVVELTRFWLGFFMDVKWLGGGRVVKIPPPTLPSYLKKEIS